MTSQILANRHTQELENMERMFTRITGTLNGNCSPAMNKPTDPF